MPRTCVEPTDPMSLSEYPFCQNDLPNWPIAVFSHRTVRIAVNARKLRIIRLIAAIVSVAVDDPRTLCLINAPIKPSTKRTKRGPSISSNFSIDV